MAAIDPSAEPELEDPDDKRPPRATLKLVRVPDAMFDDDDSDDEDFDLEDVEDDSDEDEAEEVNGGPSEKKSKVKSGDDDEEMEDEDDEEDDAEDDAKAMAQLAKIIKSVKGKGKALDGEEDADDEDDEDDESLEMDEVVICTLDPEKVCCLPINFTRMLTSHARTTSKRSILWSVKVKKSSSRSLALTLST